MRPEDQQPRRFGRYTLHGELARGGMATVYLGRLRGAASFSRVVAVKRMLPRFAGDPQFRAMFLDEATLASRIQHPNVVQTLDVVAEDGEIFIVMELVRGHSLAALLKAVVTSGERVPVPIAVSVTCGVLAGLHAAHEASDAAGVSLAIVHRDVSPHNILVGVDGVARIMDFGVAKAQKQLHTTLEGQIKGKLSYMAPEQITGGHVDRRVDLFAAGVVAWGMLAGRRLFGGQDVTDTMAEVLRGPIPPLAQFRHDVPQDLEAALRRALERDRDARWSTAREFEEAFEAAAPKVAPAREVGQWVERFAGDVLSQRQARIHEVERLAVHEAAQRDLASPLHDEGDDAPTRERSLPQPIAEGALVEAHGAAPASGALTTTAVTRQSGVATPPARSQAARWIAVAAAAGVIFAVGIRWMGRATAPNAADSALSDAPTAAPAEPGHSDLAPVDSVATQPTTASSATTSPSVAVPGASASAATAASLSAPRPGAASSKPSRRPTDPKAAGRPTSSPREDSAYFPERP